MIHQHLPPPLKKTKKEEKTTTNNNNHNSDSDHNHDNRNPKYNSNSPSPLPPSTKNPCFRWCICHESSYRDVLAKYRKILSLSPPSFPSPPFNPSPLPQKKEMIRYDIIENVNKYGLLLWIYDGGTWGEIKIYIFRVVFRVWEAIRMITIIIHVGVMITITI